MTALLTVLAWAWLAGVAALLVCLLTRLDEDDWDAIRWIAAFAAAFILTAVCITFLVGGCERAHAATVRWTNPATQADSSAYCAIGTKPLSRIDSVLVIGVPRCAAWRTWPAGWDTCGRTYVLARLGPRVPGARDSFTVAQPGTWTVWVVTRNALGWSCPSGMVTVSDE